MIEPTALAAILLLVGLTAATAFVAWRYRERWQGASGLAERERRRAEAAEARLASAPLGGIAVTADGRLDGAAPLFAALGGEVPENPMLADLRVRFDESDAAALAAAATALCQDGTAFLQVVRSRDAARCFVVAGGRGTGGAVARDVLWFAEATPLDRARREAEAGRDSLTALLDALPLPVWRRDADCTLAYCNRAYAAAVDAPAAAAVANGMELLGQSKANTAKAVAREALDAGEPRMRREHVVVSGARRLLEVRETPLDDGTLLGLALDRTETEELGGELSRHIAAHRDVLENLGTAIAIFGPDMRLEFFNTAFAGLWRLDEGFLNTNPELGDILERLREARRLPEVANFPEYKRDWIRRLQTLIDPLEELQHLPDGSTLLSVAHPHPFGGVLMTYEDVTDRLSLERSYNTLIEVQRETLDNLYEGVSVYGADGRLKLYNPAFARIWQIPETLVQGEPHVRDLVEHTRHFFDVSDDRWSQLFEARVARATDPASRSGRRERADGSVIDWAQVPLPDGAALFTFVDVTDSVRVERALLERNEALETADRLKSEFVANISYELRTPLNAIVGFAEILENQFFGELNERQLEYSHGIVESSQRLIALINDILDLATIEAGYLQLDLGAVDVAELLNSVQNLSAERAHNRGIALAVDCPPDLGSLQGDGRRLKQALFNLLSNAFKFTAEGGSVTLQAERSGDDLLLSVADTGIGIRPEDLERVFGKFERGGGLSPSGAGLGLSLVKSLVELHGGRVEIDSEPGRGTCVTCRIPYDAATRQARDEALGDAAGTA